MKSIIYLSLITLLFLLASCGSGKGTAKLEITRGFLASNTGFEGGVIVYGKDSATNEEFTVGIPSGNSANINIPYGTYNIKVVGWNSNSPIPFEGPILCGKTNFNFNTEGAVLQIQVTNNACNDTDFASNFYKTGTTNNYIFKNLALVTCGALFDPSNTQSLSQQSSISFCGQYDVDLRQEAPRYKIVYEKKSSLVAASQSLVSDCQSNSTLSTIKIPTKFPFKIELYKDFTCTQLQKTLDFPNGIESTNPDFDSVITFDSAYTFLKLPTSQTSRGLSQFISEMPQVVCTAGALANCTKILSQTSGMTPYILDVGIFQRIKLPNKVASCSSSFFNVISGSVVIDTSSCVTLNGHTYVRVRQQTAGNSTFTYDGTSYDLIFGNSASVYAGAEKTRERTLYQTLKNVYGYVNPGTHDLALQDDFVHDGRKNYGALSEIRHILSPFGVAGAFFDQPCSETPIGTAITRAISVTQPDGTVESIQATLTNPPATPVPRLFHHNSDPQNPTPDSAYNRRFIIRKLITPPSSYETVSTLDFDCDSNSNLVANLTSAAERRVGRLEEQKKYTFGLKTLDVRRIVHYNTTLENNSRIELYTETTEKDSGTIQNMQRNFYRGERMSALSESKYRISAVTYEAQRISSAYEERLRRYEIDGSYSAALPAMVYSFKDMGTLIKSEASISEIFSDKLFTKFKNSISYNYRQSLSKKDQGHISSASNGKFVHAYTALDGSLKLSAYNGTSFINQSYPSVYATNFSSDTTSSGNNMVVVSQIGSSIRVDVYNGSTWANSTIASPDTVLTDLKVSLKDDGDYLIAALTGGSDEHVYLSHGNTSTAPGTFNTYFASGGDDQVLEVDLAKTNSDFYVLVSRIDHMNSSSFLDYCKFAEMPLSCNITSFSPLIFSNDVSGRFRQISGSIVGSELRVNFKNTNDNKYYVHFGEITGLPNMTIFGDTSSQYTIKDYESSAFTTYYSTQLMWNAPYNGHAFIPAPFIPPAIQQTGANGLMNMKMLDQNIWDIFFTSSSSFKFIQ